MRKSKWLVFLMAVILCMVSVSAAFAKVPPLEEDETDAMEQRICELLQNEGYKTDYWKDVRSINIRYMDDYYHITLETKEMEQMLRENDCDYMQGFLFSRPLAEENFIRFIREHNPDEGE